MRLNASQLLNMLGNDVVVGGGISPSTAHWSSRVVLLDIGCGHQQLWWHAACAVSKTFASLG
jgi:hypothetical protein